MLAPSTHTLEQSAMHSDISITQSIATTIQTARTAQSQWHATSINKREKLIRQLLRCIVKNQDLLLDIIHTETGKVRVEALSELLYLVGTIRYYCAHASRFLRDETPSISFYKHKKGRIHYSPVGVVAVICPWNFPLVEALDDAIPALLAGNAVIVKPSEYTPGPIRFIENLMQKVEFPENLLQVVEGNLEVGQALVEQADMIAFTGSVTSGRDVIQRAAQTFKPILLELGGKDPIVVLSDANIERAVNATIWGSLFNAGQMCIAIETAYIHESVYDAFVGLLTAKIVKLQPGKDYSPVSIPRRLEALQQQISEACSMGGECLCGGNTFIHNGWQYLQPTVIANAPRDSKLMREETFGPVLALIKFSSETQLLTELNESEFGLSASIWSSNEPYALQFAKQLHVGSVCINDVSIIAPIAELPFGGRKNSGFGRRHGGANGLRQFSHSQSIVTNRIAFQREPHWIPYPDWLEGTIKKVLRLLYR
jgi:acyl-CoA reductase-like NAD-dependent aldehyde dehydrogenase